MRQLGTLPEREQAVRLADYLTAQEMLASCEPSGKAWAVWIRDEDHLDRAKLAWDEFQQNPDDPKFAGHEEQAAAILRDREERNERARENTRNANSLWQRPQLERLPVTVGLIVVCVAVTLFAQFGRRISDNEDQDAPAHFAPVTRWVAFYDPQNLIIGLGAASPFQNITEGQVWRLLTPIFLHFSITHLLFNMMWLYRIGSVLEHRRGSLWFLGFVAVTGILSNVAEIGITGPSLLGGFSGVDYALFGYAWVYSLLYRDLGFELDQFTLGIMLLWLVGGFTGLLDGIVGGRMANWAHLAGLIAGAAFAYLPHLIRLRR